MDPISTLPGMLDTSAFEEDEDAFGTKVQEEYMQIINKLNESVTGLNEVAVAQITDEAAIAANTAGRLDHETRITTNEADIAAINVLSSPFQFKSGSGYLIPDDAAFNLVQVANLIGTSYLFLPDPTTQVAGRYFRIYCSDSSTNTLNVQVPLEPNVVALSTGDSATVTVVRNSGDTANVWALTQHLDVT